jgi:hypothetical protein
MSKLILACCLLSSASLLHMVPIANYIGPSAYTMVSNVRSAFDFYTIMPALARRDRR